MGKILPVKLPSNFTSTFFYALPVACITADSDYNDWYHMNYMDFYGYKNEVNNAKYEFRFIDAISYVDQILHKNESVQIDKYDLNYFCCYDIISFIKDSIDKWSYVILYVDESKIATSPFETGVHEYLVYGYDDNNQLYMIGMNQQRLFDKFNFTSDRIKEAYDSMVSNYETGKILYRMCITNRYSSLPNGENRYYSHQIKRLYEEEKYIHKIRTYLKGETTEGPVEIINKSINPQIACGIETIEIFKRYFIEVKSGNNKMEFNLPFYLLDHKRGMYDRLIYAYEKTKREIYASLVEQYNEIVNHAIVIKNLHLKMYHSQTVQIDKIIKMLENLYTEEKKVLTQL